MLPLSARHRLPVALHEVPKGWDKVLCRALERGAHFDAPDTLWAAGWSPIPLTAKKTPVKQLIYVMHDIVHQFWINVDPKGDFSPASRDAYRDNQMVGEIATLSIIETQFVLALINSGVCSEEMGFARATLPWWESVGRPCPQETTEIVWRLLIKGDRPKWSRVAVFQPWLDDYVPMMRFDLHFIAEQWASFRRSSWKGIGEMNHQTHDVLPAYIKREEMLERAVTKIQKAMTSSASLDVAKADSRREQRRFHRPPLVRVG